MSATRLQVKVQPRASKDEVLGFREDVLRVRVTAPPDRGRANEAVIQLIAEVLGIPKSRVSLLRGAASRSKLLAVEGLGPAEIKGRLQRSQGSTPIERSRRR